MPSTRSRPAVVRQDVLEQRHRRLDVARVVRHTAHVELLDDGLDAELLGELDAARVVMARRREVAFLVRDDPEDGVCAEFVGWSFHLARNVDCLDGEGLRALEVTATPRKARAALEHPCHHRASLAPARESALDPLVALGRRAAQPPVAPEAAGQP